MTIEPTEDVELITSVITSDEIWPLAAGDGIDRHEFIPKMDKFSVWLVVRDVDVCGIILVEVENAATIRIHPYAIGAKWYYMMREFFRWYLDNSSDLQQKINAKVPVYAENASKIAFMLGFEKEGVDRLSFPKHGELHDQHILGITKDEVKGVMKWQQQSR